MQHDRSPLGDGFVFNSSPSLNCLCCQVALVSWSVRREDASLDLLTVGNLTFSGDDRYSILHQPPNNWVLVIDTVNMADTGTYICTVQTFPQQNIMVKVVVLGTPPAPPWSPQLNICVCSSQPEADNIQRGGRGGLAVHGGLQPQPDLHLPQHQPAGVPQLHHPPPLAAGATTESEAPQPGDRLDLQQQNILHAEQEEVRQCYVRCGVEWRLREIQF